jgi:hypothetical protein
MAEMIQAAYSETAAPARKPAKPGGNTLRAAKSFRRGP